jgi:hypothetical protein
MVVLDATQLLFSAQHLQSLYDFVDSALLSDDKSQSMLEKILIINIPNVDWDGLWCFEKIDSEVKCKIFLNTFLIGEYLYLEEKIEKLKEVLAHEYGHHWTLSHIMRQFIDFDFSQDRLPKKYYALRGLDESQCTPFPMDNSFEAWCRCDKEIIAEDYKFLLAPEPYGNLHRIVEAFGDSMPLANPSELVTDFIRSMNTLESLE